MAKLSHQVKKTMPRIHKQNTDEFVEQNIINYIKIDPKNPTNIRVNLDDLAMYLIKQAGRRFSVTKFENMMKQEMEDKLTGRPFEANALKAWATYVNKLSKYLTVEMNNVEQERFKKLSERDRKKN